MKDKFSEWLKKIQKIHPKADEELFWFIINFKPGNPIPLGAGRKGSFFYKKIKKISYFFYSLLENPAY